MKRIQTLLCLLLLTVGLMQAQTPAQWEKLSGDVNFYMVNDMGRNGYYDQKPLAELMGQMAEYVDPECIFAVGDIHHFYGVESTSDPLWMTNYELIYTHPDLMLPWYPVCGNHEYRGNTQAVVDYSNVSRRWMMPSRYYTKVIEDNGVSVRVVMIDTSPLIERYRENTEKYPDACKQDIQKELQWLDNELANAKETWVIVMGHHPVYAQTDKEQSERDDMQRLVAPILRKHNVDVYACGHLHNFQHIRMAGTNTDFIVNSAAALSRKVQPIEGTQFCSGATGFSVVNATATTLDFHFIDKEGKVIYTVHRTK